MTLRGETPRAYHQRRLSELKTDRSPMEARWRDLSDYVLPFRSRFMVEDRNRDRWSSKIINNTATMAARTLQSGLMSGMTSPARPWFRLTTPDPDLAEWGPAKEWLYRVERVLLMVLAKSNVYNALHTAYGELGVFGTASLILDEDFGHVVRATAFTAGEYAAACGADGKVNTLYREVELTVAQVVERFGLKDVSPTVRNLWDRKQYGAKVKVVHALEPNLEAVPGDRGPRGMPFRSCYYEEAANDGAMLRVAGYREWPAPTPRWDVIGNDTWGRSPAMDTLGDVRQLQTMERRKAQAIDKMVNPPLTGPASLMNTPVSALPGGITAVDTSAPGNGLRPVYEVNPRVAELIQDMARVEERINRGFYADLFLMLSYSDRRQMTATEVAERHEEKLLALGPVLERMEDELLGPTIDRVFAVCDRKGLLPPAPEELDGVDLKVEYISILAQAQRAVAVGAIERVAGFVGNLAGANPGVLDKLDMDQAVDEYATALGVPPTIIRTDEAVAELRAGRAQQEAQAQAQQTLMMAAQGAKTLSETDTAGTNGLTDALALVGAR